MPSSNQSTTSDQKTKSPEKAKESISNSEPVFKFKSNDIDQTLKTTVQNSYKKNMKQSLPGLVGAIKRDLDLVLPKGWIVFAGKHMTGACSYIQNTMVDVEIDGTAFVIFQTFCPE
jgi:Dynein light chain type 1